MQIEVDEEVFADDGEDANETVIVAEASDPDAASRALFQAGRRFSAVAEDET